MLCEWTGPDFVMLGERIPAMPAQPALVLLGSSLSVQTLLPLGIIVPFTKRMQARIKR